MYKRCDSIAHSLGAALATHKQLENAIAALDGAYQETLAGLRAAYQ